VPRSVRARQIARRVLAVLLVLHFAALGLYLRREQQSKAVALVLDAREQWKNGELAVAAREYREYATGFRAVSSPFLMYRNMPSEASAWFALGRIEAERGEFCEALAAYRRAMALEPGRGRREYRDLLLEHGGQGELLAFAHAELARDPTFAPAAWDLGAAYLAVGEPALAARAYARAREMLPGYLTRLAGKRPVGLSPEEADLLSLEAVAWLEAGERTRAAAVCGNLVLRARPEESAGLLCSAYLAAAAGDVHGAAALLRRYAPSGPEHRALVSRLLERLPPEARTEAQSASRH
jgi:tetratricopeptide (TPR) repeat protein